MCCEAQNFEPILDSKYLLQVQQRKSLSVRIHPLIRISFLHKHGHFALATSYIEEIPMGNEQQSSIR